MSLPPFSRSLRILWSRSANAKTAAVLASVLAYAKIQPSGAPPQFEKPTSRLDRIRRREVNLKMKDGSSFRCRLQDSGALLSVYLEEDYDPPGLQWNKMRSIVDIGAHVGAFSVWAGRRATKAQIVSVEPNPEVFGFLEHNVEANGLGARNRRIQAALAPQSGMGYLDNRGTSLGAKIVESGSGVRVPLISLEDIFETSGLDSVDFLKIDCEGSEYRVLLGASKSLMSRIQVLACEYHPGEPSALPDLIDAIESAGFKVHTTSGDVGILTAVRP